MHVSQLSICTRYKGLVHVHDTIICSSRLYVCSQQAKIYGYPIARCTCIQTSCLALCGGGEPSQACGNIMRLHDVNLITVLQSMAHSQTHSITLAVRCQ